MRSEMPEYSMVQMSIQPGTGERVLDGGMVGTVSIDVDNRDGSPILTLWFVNPMLQPVEFTLPPLHAGRLLATMGKGEELAKWESFKPTGDRDPVVDYRRTGVPTAEFGPMADMKTFLELSTGNMRFAVKFPIFTGKPPLGFTLDPALCLTLLMSLYKLYEMYDWDGHNAAKGVGKTVN